MQSAGTRTVTSVAAGGSVIAFYPLPLLGPMRFAEFCVICRMIWLDPSIDTTKLLIDSMLSSDHSGQTDNATRRNAKATMDHADIRGLVTAFHLSVAGLPAV